MTPEAQRTTSMDPPWPETGGGGRGAQHHYDVITTVDDMYRVIMLSPLRLAAFDSFMWMWATSNYLDWAMTLIGRLGYSYITDFIWRKPSISTGQYRRSRHEQLLLCKRGSISRRGQWPDSVIDAPTSKHSEKPDVFYEIIETVTPGPYLECFARTQRIGWLPSHGNQLEKSNAPKTP